VPCLDPRLAVLSLISTPKDCRSGPRARRPCEHMVILHYCGVILRGPSRRKARSIVFHISLNKLRQARPCASLIAGAENPPMISRAVTLEVSVALRFPVAVELSAASICIIPSIVDGECTHRCSCLRGMVFPRGGYRAKGNVWKKDRVIRRRSTVTKSHINIAPMETEDMPRESFVRYPIPSMVGSASCAVMCQLDKIPKG
jgi:hypothetical protein